MLRVHQRRFARGDAEKARIEAVMAVEKTAPLAVGVVARFRIGAVVERGIPSVRRHLGNAIHAVAQHAPQGPLIGRAGQADGQAHDRDRVRCYRRRLDGGRSRRGKPGYGRR